MYASIRMARQNVLKASTCSSPGLCLQLEPVHSTPTSLRRPRKLQKLVSRPIKTVHKSLERLAELYLGSQGGILENPEVHS